MRLFVLTGTCGAGKSTVLTYLKTLLPKARYACFDTDELGLNWWDYAHTDSPSRFSDDCIREAVSRAGGRDIVFASCLNPQDYIGVHRIPEEVDSTLFLVLCPSDEEIARRLKARPKERGFTSEEAIAPHVEYNAWFRRNRGKFPLCLDTQSMGLRETAEHIAAFIQAIG